MLELVTFLRTNLLDDTGGQGVDWSSHSEDDYDTYQLRWSNEELVANINEAINQVYRRAMPAKDTYNFKATIGKFSYKLPSYILKVLLVKSSDNHEIKEVSLEDIWGNKSLDKQGKPLKYVTDHLTNTLRLYPIPDKDDDISMVIYRLPLEKLELHSGDDIELKEEFILPMIHYAASLCYMKDEANVLDPNRSQYFMSLFDREFPFTSSYSTIRKSRTSNRSTRYGGL